MVRLAGLEPARVAPLPPQSSVSANSTISASNLPLSQTCPVNSASGILGFGFSRFCPSTEEPRAERRFPNRLRGSAVSGPLGSARVKPTGKVGAPVGCNCAAPGHRQLEWARPAQTCDSRVGGARVQKMRRLLERYKTSGLRFVPNHDRYEYHREPTSLACETRRRTFASLGEVLSRASGRSAAVGPGLVAQYGFIGARIACLVRSQDWAEY